MTVRRGTATGVAMEIGTTEATTAITRRNERIRPKSTKETSIPSCPQETKASRPTTWFRLLRPVPGFQNIEQSIVAYLIATYREVPFGRGYGEKVPAAEPWREIRAEEPSP
jgi:hypothetical protein